MSSNDNSMDDENEDKTITRRKVLGAVGGASIFGAGIVASNRLQGSQDAPTSSNETTRPNNSSEQPPFAENNSSDDSFGGDNSTNEGSPEDNNSGNSTDTQQPDDQREDLPSPVDYTVENPNQYNWEDEDVLMEETGLCYGGAGNEGYIGALSAEDVEAVLTDEHFSGDDPNGALNDGEFIGGLDDLDEVDGNYAVDVDRRSGEEDQLYVQLVGAQNGGLYTNRQGAYQLSELEWEEEWNDCS